MDFETTIQVLCFCVAVGTGFIIDLFFIFCFIGMIPIRVAVPFGFLLALSILSYYSMSAWPLWITALLILLSIIFFSILSWNLYIKRLIWIIRQENKRKLEM